MSALAAVAGQLGGYRRLLAIRDFRLLWMAQAVSTFGDRLTQLALAALVYSITGSEVGMGLILTVGEAPRAALGLLAGVVADRVSRKTLLMATDCLRGVVVLVLAFWTGVPLTVVYVLAALEATGTVFFSPARYAVLPDIVPRADLLDANTLDETTQGALDPVAYVAGGALITLLGARLAFSIDALTFFVSAGLIALTTRRAAAMWRARRDPPSTLPRQVAEGVRVLLADPVLRANTVLMLVATLVGSADTPLVYMLAFTHWHAGALGLGILEGALAIGFVSGALLCGPVSRALGKGPTILVGLAGTGFSMILVAMLPFWGAAVANGFAGALNMLFFVPSLTLSQERAPRDALGRVLSTRSALLSVAVFASYAAATALVSWATPVVLMAALGLLLEATALAGVLLVPAVRVR